MYRPPYAQYTRKHLPYPMQQRPQTLTQSNIAIYTCTLNLFFSARRRPPRDPAPGESHLEIKRTTKRQDV
jgi:hypothetical protein